MTYFSLFTGIGGFELGIQNASIHLSETARKEQGKHPRLGPNDGNSLVGGQQLPHCVGYSEIDKYAIQIYQSHFPDHKNYGDITKIDECSIPDFDLLVGGFPCQSFSITGKRLGFQDTRGTLFFHIARILGSKKPRLFLLENVKGLLSHDEGRTFRTIIATLDELGYDVQWQVLNSKDFGVPQNRERVFIVGHLRGTPRPEVFPFIGDGEEINDGQQSNAITATYWKGCDNHGARTQIAYTPKEQGRKVEQFGEINKGQSGRVYSPERLSPTLSTMTGGGLKEPKIIQRPRGKNTGNNHDLSPTLTGKSFQDNNHLDDGMKIRRLTPTECERLQGFPDGWTAKGITVQEKNDYFDKCITIQTISDTQRYKTLGNAVTTNVIQAVMERIMR